MKPLVVSLKFLLLPANRKRSGALKGGAVIVKNSIDLLVLKCASQCHLLDVGRIILIACFFGVYAEVSTVEKYGDLLLRHKKAPSFHQGPLDNARLRA